MHWIVQLNCQLLHNVPHTERIKVTSELSSDYDNCSSDIFNWFSKSHNHSFQADQESLFIDYIYSTFYSTTVRHYLTSFAVKRDFFHSFFSSEKDHLNQQSHYESSQNGIAQKKNEDKVMSNRNDVAQTKNEDKMMSNRDNVAQKKNEDKVMSNRNDVAQTKNENKMISNRDDVAQKKNEDKVMSNRDDVAQIKNEDEVINDRNNIARNEKMNTDTSSLNNVEEKMNVSISSLNNVEAWLTDQHSVHNNFSDTKERENGSQFHSLWYQLSVYLMFEFDSISLAEISQLLHNFWRKGEKQLLLTVLSLMISNCFCKHRAYLYNNVSIVTVLKLSFKFQFIVQNNDKQLKMTASISIIDAAQFNQSQTVLKIEQHNVQVLIHQFENYKNPEKKQL